MPRTPDPTDASRRSLAQTLFAVFVVISLLVAAIGAPVVRGQANLNSESAISKQLSKLGLMPTAGTGSVPGGSSAAAAAQEASPLNTSGGNGAGSGSTQRGAGQESTAAQSGDSRFGALKPGGQSPIGSQGPRTGRTAQNAQRNQSSAVHLTYRAAKPLYLRTAAYSKYTGTSFIRGTTPRSFDGSVGGGAYTATATTRTYTVTLKQPATAIPHTWRLTAVAASTTPSAPLVTTKNGDVFARGGTFPAGTTFRLTSAQPPANPSVLRRATGRDPASIEATYTQLPDDLPTRVRDRTDAIVTGANADTRYEKAVAIERYLERTKEYSLNARHPERDAVVDTFLFEMEKGYCEYFAATMAVMLRTEGIPTRFVTGYAPGEPAQSTGKYIVRAKHAHAWVEVYFPDVGWVRFDPTPSASRESADRQASTGQPRQQASTSGSPSQQLQQRRAATAGAQALNQTSPPRNLTALTNTSSGTLSLGNTTTAANRTRTITTQSGTTYRIAVPQPLIPGTDVTITVTSNGAPAPGVLVRVNDDPVGVTDDQGRVNTTVPFTENVTVSIDPERSRRAVIPPSSVTRQYDVPLPAPTALYATGGSEVFATNTTVPVTTNATVNTTGVALPGRTIRVTATIRDVPVKNAAVLVNGDRVGTTDADGTAAVTVPRTTADSLTITVTRGPVTGNTTVTVPAINISTASNGPFGLLIPTKPTTVTVTAADTPLQQATVRVSGSAVGTTAADGTVTATVPIRPRVTVVAETPGGATGQTTVTTALIPGLIALLLIGALVAALIYAGTKHRDTVAAIIQRLRTLASNLVDAVKHLPDHARTLVERVKRRLLNAVYRASAALVAAASDIRAAVASLSLSALSTLLREFIAAVREALRARLTRTDDPAESARTASESDATASSGTAMQLLRQAWRVLITAVGYSDTALRTTTPGEVARAATTKGLPQDDVTVITDAFRDAMYGPPSKTPEQHRLEAVKHAATSLADHVPDAATAPFTDDATESDHTPDETSGAPHDTDTQGGTEP